MKAIGSFLDGGFGEARGLEEAAGNSGVTHGVEGGRRFGFVGSDGRVGVERCGGGELGFYIVGRGFCFDYAVPAGWGGPFGKRGILVRRFSAVREWFLSGYGGCAD